MREPLTFICEGAALAGTLDRADGEAGLLIVSGGNEIRCGAHRGMARLARGVAGAGHPVLRFDRRGVGDSEGDNGGFHASGPDIAAALAAFRRACPAMTRIAAFGNCDAATALVLHDAAVDGLLLANPWVVEPVDDLPPAPAIRDRYARRIRDPEAWAALLTGKVDLRAVARGLGRIALPGRTPQPLAQAFAEALARRRGPARILLAAHDGTALAFADAWRGETPVTRIDTASHSFAGEGDYAALLAAVLGLLAEI